MSTARRVQPPILRLLLACQLALVAVACNSKLKSNAPPASAAPAFLVDAIEPADGDTDVPRDAPIVVRVSGTIDRSSLGGGLAGLADVVVVERLDGVPAPERVAGSYELADNDTSIVFRPTAPLAVPTVRYRVDVFAAVRDVDGTLLDVAGSPLTLPAVFETETVVDTIPPQFAGVTSLEIVSSSALRAAWNDASDDVTPVADIIYRVYRNDPPLELDVDYTSPVVETLGGVTDALITRLTPDTEYTVGVRAVDAAGNQSDNVETIVARTLQLPPDTTAPAFDGIELLLAASETSLEARWSSAIDDRDAAGDIAYRVYVAEEGAAIDFGQPFLTTSTGVTQTFLDGLASDTTHDVVVRAVDTSDNEDDNDKALAERTLASFANDVFPIFSSRALGGCIRAFCHAAQNSAGSLSLETWDDLVIRGGRTTNPRSVVPGNAAGSLLIWRIDESSPNFIRPRMPSGGAALAPELIATIRRWIDQGALNN